MVSSNRALITVIYTCCYIIHHVSGKCSCNQAQPCHTFTWPMCISRASLHRSSSLLSLPAFIACSIARHIHIHLRLVQMVFIYILLVFEHNMDSANCSCSIILSWQSTVFWQKDVMTELLSQTACNILASLTLLFSYNVTLNWFWCNVTQIQWYHSRFIANVFGFQRTWRLAISLE